jgi:hypothetical protein
VPFQDSVFAIELGDCGGDIPPKVIDAVCKPAPTFCPLIKLRSLTSVHVEPLYNSVLSVLAPGSPHIIIPAVCVPAEAIQPLAVLTAPLEAHVPIAGPPSLTTLNCPDVEL